MAVEIVRLDGAGIAPVRDEILRVYADAFAAPPYNERPENLLDVAAALAQHTTRRGFRCYLAQEPADGRVVGFAYGYTGGPGGWWHDTVAPSLGPALVERWLGDYFEFVDLAVEPAAQGHGIGGRLHDALLDGLPQRTAALSTAQEETVALHLYRRRGWLTLLENFYFPNRTFPYRIMGRDLRGG